MSSSFHNADTRTHRKVVLTGLLFCATFVAISFLAREQPDSNFILIKAGKPMRTAGAFEPSPATGKPSETE